MPQDTTEQQPGLTFKPHSCKWKTTLTAQSLRRCSRKALRRDLTLNTELGPFKSAACLQSQPMGKCCAGLGPWAAIVIEHFLWVILPVPGASANFIAFPSAASPVAPWTNTDVPGLSAEILPPQPSRNQQILLQRGLSNFKDFRKTRIN